MEIQRDNLVYLLSLQMGFEDIGVYPQQFTDAKGKTTKRTKWQDGWNAHGTKLLDNSCVISRFLEKLSDKTLTLILKEKLHIHVNKKEAELYVNCNDLFWWGCADAESIPLKELPDLLKALKESPKNGDLLWVARKRKMRPQTPYYKYFNDKEKKLFNACGEPREAA